MQILSPYCEDVLTELRGSYGFSSIEVAEEFIIHHLQQQYPFQVVSLEELHIGTGMAAKLSADGEIYYLKFSSREIHETPDQLFPWLDYARKQGILIPEIIPTINGGWYLSICFWQPCVTCLTVMGGSRGSTSHKTFYDRFLAFPSKSYSVVCS